jgi:hypothetical protein
MRTIQGATPEDAARNAEISYHNTRPAFGANAQAMTGHHRAWAARPGFLVLSPQQASALGREDNAE